MKLIILFILLSFTNLIGQDLSDFGTDIKKLSGKGLSNFSTTVYYNEVWKIDFDTNKWEFLGNYNSSLIINIKNDNSGELILYYNNTKTILKVKGNFLAEKNDGNKTYLFYLDGGRIARLGVTPENYISVFSLIFSDRTTLSFAL